MQLRKQYHWRKNAQTHNSFNLELFFGSVNVTFIDRDGNPTPVKGKVGDNLLYLAHRYGIEMEGMH